MGSNVKDGVHVDIGETMRFPMYVSWPDFCSKTRPRYGNSIDCGPNGLNLKPGGPQTERLPQRP